MHPLQNGSQVTDRPARKERVGTAGYFSESNDSGAPSYPGQDWFNDVIDEFKNALAAAGVVYAPEKLDNLAKLFEANGNQFAPYRADRIYKTGEVCCTISDGEVSFWQWYSNVESLAGKDPLTLANRHEAWSDNTKPFYWVPYTGDQIGMPFFWISETPPEWAVMEINADLPVAVYWRLARRYPHLVSGDTINTGEIRGEFLRVLDQDRGIDTGRQLNSFVGDSIKQSGFNIRNDAGGSNLVSSAEGEVSIFNTTGSISVNGSSNGQPQQRVQIGSGQETAPRSVARPMAIAI